MKLNGEFILIKKISCMTQINVKFKMDGLDEGREDPKGVFQEATQALAWGEQGNRYGSKYRRS